MTKKSLALMVLSAMFLLPACSDKSLIKDNNNNPGEAQQLGKQHVNDFGQPITDPNLKYNLFVVVDDKNDKVNNCKGFLRLETHLSAEQCDQRKLERTEQADIPKDYTREDIKEMFGVDREPVKGVTRQQLVYVPIVDKNGEIDTKEQTITNWNYKCDESADEEALVKKLRDYSKTRYQLKVAQVRKMMENNGATQQEITDAVDNIKKPNPWNVCKELSI